MRRKRDANRSRGGGGQKKRRSIAGQALWGWGGARLCDNGDGDGGWRQIDREAFEVKTGFSALSSSI